MGDTRDMTSVQVGDADDLADIFLRAGVRLAAIACMPLGDIRRSRSAIVGRPIRSSRHTVIVPTSGVGGHIVDSSDFQLQPGRAAHILPGQVQRFVPDQELEGWVLSIEPLVCPPGLFDIARPSPVVCLGPSVDVAHALVSSLISPDILPATAQERLRISIASVLLELIAGANDGPEIPNELAREYELVADFRRELEFHYLDTRSVSDYASMIGCSAKTLTLGKDANPSDEATPRPDPEADHRRPRNLRSDPPSGEHRYLRQLDLHQARILPAEQLRQVLLSSGRHDPGCVSRGMPLQRDDVPGQ